MRKLHHFTALWHALALTIVFQLIAGLLLLAYRASPLSGGAYSRVHISLIQIFCQVFCMILPTWFLAAGYSREPLESLRVKSARFGTILLALVGLVGVCSLYSGVSTIIENILPAAWMDFYRKSLDEALGSYKNLLGWRNSGEFVLAAISGALMPAISEELLFRGYAQRSIEKFNPVLAIIVVSASFAIVHFNPMQLPELFIIGLYLALLAYFTGSIIVPIAAHFANNFIMILSLAPGADSNPVQSDLATGMAMTFFGLLVAYVSLALIYNNRVHYYE